MPQQSPHVKRRNEKEKGKSDLKKKIGRRAKGIEARKHEEKDSKNSVMVTH
jgi:hypothetical protein